MKAFITGGTGFIGSHLIDYLMDRGFEIYALIRDPNNLKWLEGKNINFLEGDLFSIPSLPSDIHYVFHLAGCTKASKLAQYYTVNQQGTASLIQSLLSQNISPKKIIYLSSIAAGGPALEENAVKEDDTPHPITPYGLSKLGGEEEIIKYSKVFSTAILRVGIVFGPRDESSFDYFKFTKKGLFISLRSSQGKFSLCYINDLVNALHLCTQAEIKSGEIFNIADSRIYSYDDLGEAAGKILNKKLKKIAVPLPLIFLWALFNELIGFITKKPNIFDRIKLLEMKQKSWAVDTLKAKEKLNFKTQYTLEEAVKETIQWYLENDWI